MIAYAFTLCGGIVVIVIGPSSLTFSGNCTAEGGGLALALRLCFEVTQSDVRDVMSSLI